MFCSKVIVKHKQFFRIIFFQGKEISRPKYAIILWLSFVKKLKTYSDNSSYVADLTIAKNSDFLNFLYILK